METKSGRSSKVSDRSTPSSRISRPGSAVDLILERISAAQADTRKFIEAVQANLRAIQIESRGGLGSVRNSLERLETSPASKFVAGFDLNSSLSSEMTATPNHSTISLEAKQSHPEVSTGPWVPRRSERLVNKPKVDYRQVALQLRWPIPTEATSNPCPVPTLYPSSSFATLQQHATPSAAFETMQTTLVERGWNGTDYTNYYVHAAFEY